ncbi:MAG: InlB B-repeat-containing protein, partial [Clostridia bacterium]|nr:InlB B-repeat-containing protein [Clostridia bacterium]
MKNFKKLCVFVITLFMTMSLVACGFNSNKENSNNGNNSGDNSNPNFYIVTMMSDNSVYKIKQVNPNEKVEKPDDPVKEYFTFAGWYNGDTLWDFENDVVTSDITLTAKFEQIYVNANFYVDGKLYDSKSIPAGAVFEKPEVDPEKENYEFAGWYNGDTLWNFETDVTNEDITLTAKFEIIHYNVTFFVNDEILVMKKVVSGEKVERPEDDPYLENYEFLGWYEGEKLWDFNKKITKYVSLVAKFKRIYFDVVFLSDDVVYQSKEIASGSVCEKPMVDPVKENYEFKGWYYGNLIYDFEDVVKEDLTLTAKFEQIYFTLTLVVEGKDDETRQVASGNKIQKPENPSKVFFVFAGWYNGETLWNFETDVMKSNITLTAKFEPLDDINGVFINISGYELKENDTYKKHYYKAVSNSVEQYDFNDDIEVGEGLTWSISYKDVEQISGAINLEMGDNVFTLVVKDNSSNVKEYLLVVRRKLVYEVSFNTNGGGKIDSQMVEEDSLATIPTKNIIKTGYDFIGWDYNFENPIKGNVTVNAKYSPIVYTATFIADEKIVDTKKFIVEDTELKNIPEVPAKLGYTGEWETYQIKAGNIIINAIYTLTNFTANFIANGKVVATRIFTINDTVISSVPTAPSKVGYTVKWAEYEIIAEDIEINAIYTAIEYIATFKADGNVVETRFFTVEDSVIKNMPQVPYKEGYTGEWEKYTIKAGHITINAIYSVVEYTATFKADGKVVATRNFTMNSNSISYMPEVPYKAGYIGKWEDYTLGAKDIEINAIYTAIEYSATFKIGDDVVAIRTFTVEDVIIENAPQVPSRVGYTGNWEKYTIKAENIVVNAELMVYVATFKADGEVVATRNFTILDKEIKDIPEVPKKPYYTGEWGIFELAPENIEIIAIYTLVSTVDEDGYIIILSKEELLNYASKSKNFTENARLYADIDLGGIEWTPIASNVEIDYASGKLVNSYSAIFDGNGYTISNFKITKYKVVDDYIFTGFFGTAQDATITSLKLDNFVIDLMVQEEKTLLYTGGLVGYASNSTIEKSCAVGDINATSPLISYVGGLVGNASNSTIKNTYAKVDIMANADLSLSADNAIIAGGLVGYVSVSNIENSYATGSVNVTSSSDKVCLVAGGLIGENYGNSKVTKSYATGDVIATATSENSSAISGGLVGFTAEDLTVTDCYRDNGQVVRATMLSSGV